MVEGILTISEFDEKGFLIGKLQERNMVTDAGIRALWGRITTADTTASLRLDTLVLGDDFGNPNEWSIFNPEPPNRSFTAADQNATYTIPEVTFEFPSDEALRCSVLIDGTETMNNDFPEEIEYHYTSMTLRFNNGTVFSFKRFPIRSISRNVQVFIDWRFRVVNAPEWCDV